MKHLFTGYGGPPARPRPCRSGQAVIFLLMAFTILVFFLMFHVDLHRVIQRKNQAQNAGDAAALATARWQGATLNLIGELNLLHVLALSVADTNAVDAITNMQARLSFTGPLAALYAAQVAAKNNHIYVDPALTGFYKEHANTIRTQYASQMSGGGGLYFTEPWEGAWGEYADILDAICGDGLAAGPDNARFFTDPGGGHVLFNQGFYEAVLGASWCWFHLFQRGLLESYHSFHDWPPVPELDAQDYSNSEIFGLGLHPFSMALKNRFNPSELGQHIEAAEMADQIVATLDTTNVMDVVETWYMYNRSDWGEWEEIKIGGELDFPAAGNIRPQYDYRGADAVLRVSAAVDRIMPDSANQAATVNWTAASKPFGYLDAETGKERPNSAADFVLPAFRDVRLIPADTASNSGAFSSDIEWVHHLKEHLHDYMDGGTTHPGCSYCNALVKWEQPVFRQTGIEWLKENSHKCRLPSGGGGGRGGGSKRGH